MLRTAPILLLKHRPRERGNVLVLAAVMTIVVMGVSALVIDVGLIQDERSKMQGTCDAAALAGAKQLPNVSTALVRARNISDRNGYINGTDEVTVTGVQNPDGQHPGYYRVTISAPVNFLFAPIMGIDDGVITMSATAAYVTPLPMYIFGNTNEYGTTGIMNLSAFGPYGQYSYGDCYSARWLDNGAVNPAYEPDGFNFVAKIGSDYYAKNGTNIVNFQIFDPDCYNVGNANDAGVGKIDEIRTAPASPHPQPSTKYTTTEYKLYAPSSTPTYDDDVLIASAIWTPSMKTSDMKWVTPNGWQVNLATYGFGDYRINVETTNGSSENGFNLRAGSPAATADGGTWNPNNGTEITATGKVPINFNVNGSVDICLGYIPSEAGGHDVFINKFDTDVGAKTVLYYDEFGHQWPGLLSGNGTFKIDKIDVPDGYSGGRLYARYSAGAQDTSAWQMYFDGQWPGSPGELRLVD